MSNTVLSLQKDISKFKSDIVNILKFIEKLERKKSDTLYCIKIADQNLKYMKKNDSVAIASHFKKITKFKKTAEKEIENINIEMKHISLSLEKMKKNLKLSIEKLENLKRKLDVKVIPFKSKR